MLKVATFTKSLSVVHLSAKWFLAATKASISTRRVVAQGPARPTNKSQAPHVQASISEKSRIGSWNFALASILILNMEFRDDIALKGDNPDNAARENSA
jgi:hypothetical protein